MLVYRIEDSQGRGPYDSAAITGWDSGQHPTPRKDGMPPIHRQTDFFGFKSLRQLHDWFDDEILDELIYHYVELGGERFTMNTYSIDEEYVKFGEKQVAFWKGYAEHIFTTHLEELLTIE